MDKLPPEILHTIFIKLDLRQRLKCLLVCRNWFSVLDRYCLFFDIKMDADKEQFSRARRVFKRFPERGAQVKQVHVYIKDDTLFNKRELFKFFPNARVMKASPDWSSGHARQSHFTRNINLTHSKSKLQVLHDCGHCELVSQMLYSNLGGQLQTLFLDFTQVFGTKSVLSQLKDLPVLKKFTLKGSWNKLDEIEKMHNNIPSIKDLAFYHVTIEKGKMPSSIKPAIRVTTFELYNGRFSNTKTHAQFYRYMTVKYANITTLEYADKEIDRYNIKSVRFIYLNGLLDFFKLVGIAPDKLPQYGLPDGIGIFKDQEPADGPIKGVSFTVFRNERTKLEYLSDPILSQRIDRLGMVNTGIDSIPLVKNLTALTELLLSSIGPDHELLDLTDCLDVCPPTLKKLTIYCHDLIIKPFKNKLISIKILHIDCDKISSAFGEIVSSCFPNLLKLTLRGVVTENVTIALNNPHFQKASFSTSGIYGFCSPAHGFSFSWPNQNEPLYYLSKFDTRTETRNIKFVPNDLLEDVPILSVILSKEKRIDLKNDICAISC